MSHRVSVFICMPYGDHNTPKVRDNNARNAMGMWHELYSAGFEAYCPLLSHYLHEYTSRPREEWLAHSMYWLEKCDCVYVPADAQISEGMKLEIIRAQELKKPVYRFIGGYQILHT